MKHWTHSARRRIPLFPVIPLVPLALFAGSMTAFVVLFRRLRRLEAALSG